MAKQDELTIQAIEKKYHGQWVLLEVTATYKDGRSRKGRVVAHDPDEKKVFDEALKFYRSHPNTRTFFFYCGPKMDMPFILYAKV